MHLANLWQRFGNFFVAKWRQMATLGQEFFINLGKEKTLGMLKFQGFCIGTPSGARTPDALIKSQVLYQLS